MSAVTKLKRPATRDHLRSVPRPERVLTVCRDEDALKAFTEAQSEFDRAELLHQGLKANAPLEEKRRAAKRLKEATAARDKARDECEDKSVELLLRSVGRKRFRELLQEHETSPEDKEKAEKAGRDAEPLSDAFTAALLAETCVDPQMTPEEWQEILDDLSGAEHVQLYMAAQGVNTQSHLVDFGRGSNGTRS